MSQLDPGNPYATAVAAAEAPVAERAAFLRRTYSLLFAGVLGFAATLWAAGNLAPVRDMMIGLWKLHPLVVMLLILGAGFLVRMVAAKHPINLVAYFAYVFLFGLLLAPLVLHAAQIEVLNQAAMITVLVFSGLTAYVFLSGKDFSFLGGILSIAVMGMIGLIVAGILFGFGLGLWFSVLGVLVYSGFVLSDTSRILHHYPTNAHVAAAIELFTSLVILFQYILILLSNRD